MRARNYNIYSNDPTWLNTLAEEYRSLGRFVRRQPGQLTVFALRPVKPKPKKEEDDKRDNREVSE
jgi:hypothetical protein